MAHGKDVRSEALKLTAKGISARDAEIRLHAEGHEVSYRSIARWDAARVAAANAAGPKTKPARAASSKAASMAPTSSTPDLPSVDALAEEAESLLDGADRAHNRLDQLHQKLTARIDDELALTIPDLKTLAPITKLVLEIAVVLAKTRPPIAIRPEDDPTNLEASERLLERLDKLVVSARRNVGLDVPATVGGSTA